MQVPYEYRRSQTIASKFARSALTQRQILLPPSGKVARSADRGSFVILSASEISHRTIALLNKLSLRGSIATAAGSTARPPFGALTRATSPVSSGESTPGRVNTARFYPLSSCYATLAKTKKQTSLPPSGEVSATPTIGDVTSY